RISNLIPVTFFGLFFGLIGSFIFTIYHLAEERRTKTIKLQQEQCRLELKNLIAQINPHFLFNTLNSIASLIHQDADKAEQMVHKLSNMFRYCLQSSDNQTVQLKKEIEIITQYLEIEKIRFADRLRYQMQIEPECLPLQIPPLILQTLVENGVKHGISPLLEGGRITVKAYIKNDKLCLSVSDTGMGFQVDQINSGFGLTAVKNILNLLYGNEHEFQILANKDTEVRIVLPKDQSR
ncbi:MAG: histidine kinase, partial [Candidatus Cloacimonetes bacterium]|nr:histidine kinase [Candidatus Cloacimonadota bacterium]